MVGQTGLEPVTSRLSSARSNQLSYRPVIVYALPLFLKGSLQGKPGGGMGIRTPDIQLAKLALYQLSYTPVGSEKTLSAFQTALDSVEFLAT